MRTIARIGVALTVIPFLAGCASTHQGAGSNTASAKGSLYQRLGEKKAIVAVVDDFVGRVAGDKRINKFFANTDLRHLKKQLVDMICEAAGGPCKYKGASMKLAHKDMGVTNAGFDALVEDLVAALDKFQVGKTEQDELLAVLGPMRKDIVEKD